MIAPCTSNVDEQMQFRSLSPPQSWHFWLQWVLASTFGGGVGFVVGVFVIFVIAAAGRHPLWARVGWAVGLAVAWAVGNAMACPAEPSLACRLVGVGKHRGLARGLPRGRGRRPRGHTRGLPLLHHVMGCGWGNYRDCADLAIATAC